MDGPMDPWTHGRLTSSAVRTRRSNPIRGRHSDVGVVGIPTRTRLRSTAARGFVVPRSVGRRDRSAGVGDRAGGAVSRGGGGGGRRPRLPHAAHPTSASGGEERRVDGRADAAASAARAGRSDRDLRGVDTVAGVATIACGLGRRHRLRLDGRAASLSWRWSVRGRRLRTPCRSLGLAAGRSEFAWGLPDRLDRRGLARSTRSPRRGVCGDRVAPTGSWRRRGCSAAILRSPSRLGSLAWCPRRPCLQKFVLITRIDPRARSRERAGCWR